ncbi:helix-turn-helix domain-containing protein [Pedobacter duraquae]|uniref:AraC-like DNA-binding protein n=1 Tax=Pedobacter duraquae TaxID=425511 RepID=A0A4R6IHP0_9SPHI|nr:AraC family transcriptional regulator [Pedobacter duraquae]TDO20755.1 AraC-like DNA-binding protein [Pedobacter duraquae]
MLKIETIQPREELREYIDFYYLIRNECADFKNTHYSFPHTVNAVTIYKEAAFYSSFTESNVSHDSANNFITVLQGKRQLPLKVNIAGKTDRICIWFKPLWINHFINVPLSDVMGKTSKRFTNWDQDPAYLTCLKACFEKQDATQRIHCLEEFMLSKLQPLNTDRLNKALQLLCDFEKAYTIDEIANDLAMSIRTFNRTFKQMIGVSPVEYRSIARFRHSMNDKLFSSSLKKLTDIGHNSNFYDQSYFIKMYKKLAGSAPSDFFSAIEKLGDDKLIFQFLT